MSPVELVALLLVVEGNPVVHRSGVIVVEACMLVEVLHLVGVGIG